MLSSISKKKKKKKIFHLEGKNYQFALPNCESCLDPSRRPSRRITKDDYLVDRGKKETVNSSIAGETVLFHRIKDTEIETPRGVHPVPSEGGAGAYPPR